ncbi:hypothetical protein M9H77_36370 [Catharanthus roseus]|uniref:Uncharacterized protein n=1 Tax=Catharanthus roseus TaxID=4058 RepID=A0ACB9ZVC2_CATRO|nr:hypothetical protein M9H77_36370 [Catharanthus roseus]
MWLYRNHEGHYLNNKFSFMRSKTLNTYPSPNLDKVFANAIHKEQHQKTVAEPDEQVDGAAFFVKSITKPTCDYCGKIRHEKDYWNLHGKPNDGHNGHPRGRRQGNKSWGRGARFATANHITSTNDEAKLQEKGSAMTSTSSLDKSHLRELAQKPCMDDNKIANIDQPCMESSSEEAEP